MNSQVMDVGGEIILDEVISNTMSGMLDNNDYKCPLLFIISTLKNYERQSNPDKH